MLRRCTTESRAETMVVVCHMNAFLICWAVCLLDLNTVFVKPGASK